MGRYILKGLALLAAVFLVLQILVHTDGHYDIASGSKIRSLGAQGDTVTTIFFGSSRTYRHVIPELFDSLRTEADHPTYSYNLGVPAADAYEVSYLVDRVLSMELPALRELVVEVGPVGLDIGGLNATSRRTVSYHDLRRTRMAMQAAVVGSDSPWQAWLRIWDRFKLALRRATLAGQFKAYVSSQVQERQPARNRGQGYQPLEAGRSERLTNRRANYLTPESQQRYRFLLDSLLAAPPPEPSAVDRLTVHYLNDIVARARGRGVDVVFVTQVPDFVSRGLVALRGELQAPLIALNDPHRYPELYDPENLFDRAHLMQPAALRVTELIAEGMNDIGRRP